jgi:hypothetical protein
MKSHWPGAFLTALAAALVPVGACKKSEPQPVPAASASASASANAGAGDAAWRNEVSELKQQMATLMKNRQTRVARAELEGITSGANRQAKFKITNSAKQKIAAVEAWVYYYDADGNYLAHHAGFVDLPLAPGASASHALGYHGNDLPAQTKNAECEITMVEWEDGTEWTNENLKLGKSRRPGGPSDEELLRREGEMVVGKWTGGFGKSQRPVLKLANVSGRPLRVAALWTFYYAENGELLDRQRDEQGVELAADGFIEIESGALQADIDQDTRFIEVAVPKVEFTDGKRDSWANENLSRSDRPMRVRPKQ